MIKEINIHMKQVNTPEEAYVLLRDAEEKIINPSLRKGESFELLQRKKLFYLQELEKWWFRTDEQLDLLRLRISTTVLPQWIEQLSSSQKIEKTIYNIWREEFKFFLDFFGLEWRSYQDIVNYIERLQEWFGYTKISQDSTKRVDWEIGAWTLQNIYLRYYATSQNLPHFIQHRLDIFNEMSRYADNPRNHHIKWLLHPTTVPNIFSKVYYFWEIWGQNKPNTFVNQELSTYIDNWEIPYSLGVSKNTIVVSKIYGKFYLAVYLNGLLTLATYCSPWDPNQDGGIITKVGVYTIPKDKNSVYHISWADASVTEINGKKYGAIMPYAFNIYWWVFWHAGIVNGERKSHWCIRTPMFYAKAIYEIIRKNWNFQVDIKAS